MLVGRLWHKKKNFYQNVKCSSNLLSHRAHNQFGRMFTAALFSYNEIKGGMQTFFTRLLFC